MKPLNLVLARSLGALLAGLLLVVFADDASRYIIICLGALFFIPSLLTLAGRFLSGSSQGMMRSVGSLGSLCFGILLMSAPDFFARFLTYVLGFMVVMAAIQQLSGLLAARRSGSVSWGFFVLPVLLLLGGMMAVFSPSRFNHAIFTGIGICCILYGLYELFGYFRFTRRLYEKAPEMDRSGQGERRKVIQDDDIEDAKIVD